MELKPRNKETSADVVITTRYWKNYPSTQNYSTYDYTQVRNSSSMFGASIPNFHKRLKAGELLPMTPFSQISVTGDAEGFYSIAQGTNKHWCTPSNGFIHFPQWIVTFDEVAALAPTANTNLAAEAAAAIYNNGHDTLTFLAELTDVKRLFVDVGRMILKGRYPKKSTRNLSTSWLSARYGWRTLISDIKNLEQAIRTFDEKRTRYSERRGTKSSFTSSQSWVSYAGHGTRTHYVMDTVSVSNRGSVVADVDIPKFQFNPLMTGWELVPYSFVLDWFVSVGKTLATWSFLSLSPNYVASTGCEVKLSRYYEHNMTSWASGWSGTDKMNAECEGLYQVRTPCTIPYTPRISVRLDTYKIIDLIALLIQKPLWR